MFKMFNLTDFEKVLFLQKEVRVLKGIIAKKNEHLQRMRDFNSEETRVLWKKIENQKKAIVSLQDKLSSQKSLKEY